MRVCHGSVVMILEGERGMGKSVLIDYSIKLSYKLGILVVPFCLITPHVDRLLVFAGLCTN